MTKQVLITGATEGIGKAIANKLCSDSFTPILIARSIDRLKQMSPEFRVQFPKIDVANESCDVSNPTRSARCLAR